MPKTIDEMRNDMYIIRTSIGIDSESKKTASTILGHMVMKPYMNILEHINDCMIYLLCARRISQLRFYVNG